jgi:DHA1 family bicyclomycin/chloramphenicol resistance-like MFS transporter
MRRALGAGMDEVQLTLSLFLVGFALAQAVWGPLADRLGRRPVLFAGLGLFTVGAVACALAPTIEVLIAARVLQALGASVGIVVAPAIVRDLQADGPGARESAARLLAHVATARAMAPAVAPILGGYLQGTFGWQSSFFAQAAFALAALAAVALFLGETLTRPDPHATSPRHIASNARAIAGDRGWRAYALASAFCYCGLFAYISGSSFVLIGVHGLSPEAYGAAFALGVAGYMGGTQAGARLTQRLGVDRMVRVGGAVAFGAGALMLALSEAQVGGIGSGGAAAVLGPTVLYMIGAGLVLPNAVAGAVSPFPRMAGTASAMAGLLQMGLASVLGVAVAAAFDGSAVPMARGIAISGALTFAAGRILPRRRSA